MDRAEEISQKFSELKSVGIEAKNPDQSVAMAESFHEIIEICRWKGFSENDIKLESICEIIEKCNDILEESKKNDWDPTSLSLDIIPNIDWNIEINIDGVGHEELYEAMCEFEESNIKRGLDVGWNEIDEKRELRRLIYSKATQAINNLQFLKDKMSFDE